MQRCVHEYEVPDEEGLVEAQITWEIGKALGCSTSNKKAMIEAIAKVPECKDFVLPRKRGRSKNIKG